MKTKRKIAIAIRFSLITAIIHAIALLMIYGIDMPTVDKILWLKNNAGEEFINLPFALSRWFDVLLGPIYSFVLVFLFTANSQNLNLKNNDFDAGLAAVLGIGLIAGLIFVIKSIFNRNFWTKTGNWLMAQEKEFKD